MYLMLWLTWLFRLLLHEHEMTCGKVEAASVHANFSNDLPVLSTSVE